MNFFTQSFFFNRINFLIGGTNIYFKQITSFEKTKKDFVKIVHIFFLKI